MTAKQQKNIQEKRQSADNLMAEGDHNPLDLKRNEKNNYKIVVKQSNLKNDAIQLENNWRL